MTNDLSANACLFQRSGLCGLKLLSVVEFVAEWIVMRIVSCASLF